MADAYQFADGSTSLAVALRGVREPLTIPIHTHSLRRQQVHTTSSFPRIHQCPSVLQYFSCCQMSATLLAMYQLAVTPLLTAIYSVAGTIPAIACF